MSLAIDASPICNATTGSRCLRAQFLSESHALAVRRRAIIDSRCDCASADARLFTSAAGAVLIELTRKSISTFPYEPEHGPRRVLVFVTSRESRFQVRDNQVLRMNIQVFDGQRHNGPAGVRNRLDGRVHSVDQIVVPYGTHPYHRRDTNDQRRDESDSPAHTMDTTCLLQHFTLLQRLTTSICQQSDLQPLPR